MVWWQAGVLRTERHRQQTDHLSLSIYTSDTVYCVYFFVWLYHHHHSHADGQHLEDRRCGAMDVDIVPNTFYDPAKAKIYADLRWLFGKAYGTGESIVLCYVIYRDLTAAFDLLRQTGKVFCQAVTTFYIEFCLKRTFLRQ